MDIDFINSYNEVLTENVEALVKQNILIQARLRLAEKNVAILIEQNKQTEKAIREEQANLKDHDRERLQVAYNDILQQNVKLKEKNESLINAGVELENDLIRQLKILSAENQALRDMIPASKLKKINITLPEENKTEDGSSF